MTIEDPTLTPEGGNEHDTGATGAEGAAAAVVESDAGAAAQPGADEGGADTKTPEESAREAFRKGVEEAVDDGEGAHAPADAGKAGDKPGGAAAKPEAGKPAAAATPPADETDEAKAERVKTEAVEAEIKDLGLKNEKAQARFRELAARPTLEEVAPLREKAARADEWEEQIRQTGASAEQFAATVNYTALAVAANAGDIKAAELAYKSTLGELEHWAKMLGKEAPGVDPLEAHPDLKAEVENGDLPRARALEVAQARAAGKVTADTTARTTKEQQDRTAYESAVTSAMAGINALGTTLKAADPAFEQKLAMLAPAIDVIRRSMHPSQWEAAVREAYGKLPAIAAPAAPAKPAAGPMPIRPVGTSAGQKQKPQTPLEAFRIGAATVRG